MGNNNTQFTDEEIDYIQFIGNLLSCETSCDNIEFLFKALKTSILRKGEIDFKDFDYGDVFQEIKTGKLYALCHIYSMDYARFVLKDEYEELENYYFDSDRDCYVDNFGSIIETHYFDYDEVVPVLIGLEEFGV